MAEVWVWLVELRQGDGSNATHAHTASTKEKAIAWIKAQKPKDWEPGWWALCRSLIDADVVEELQAGENCLEFFDLNGEHLEEQPLC